MSTITNFYPPIMATTLPGFIYTNACEVGFDLSPLNNKISDIRYAQVTISHQRTGRSALSSTLYPNGIKVTTISSASSDKDYGYYVNINLSDLESKSFDINQYYLVQIRFCHSSCETFPTGQTSRIQWFANNSDKFSEWSSVCLIRPISAPSLNFDQLNGNTSSSLTSDYNSNTLILNGSCSFARAEEEDCLSKYKILIYDANESPILETDFIQCKDNKIYYLAPYYFESKKIYHVKIKAVTFTEYSFVYNAYIKIGINDSLNVNGTIEVEADNDNGRFKIQTSFTKVTDDSTYILIRRASNKNPDIWESIFKTKLTKDTTRYYWEDYTTESGYWYKYGFQLIKENSANQTPLYQDSEFKRCQLTYCYLVGNSKQLQLSYDLNISSFERKISESLVETIGSKYPFVLRNATVNYRTFPISGTISSFMDYEEIFTSNEELFQLFKTMYDSYNEDNDIKIYYDFTKEKFFRDKIIDFLYTDKPLLFKSATEGNILIKLTNISFAPNEVLGRLIYSFSATATEIGDCTVSNIDKFDIQSAFSSTVQSAYYQYDIISLGQVNGNEVISYNDINGVDTLIVYKEAAQ